MQRLTPNLNRYQIRKQDERKKEKKNKELSFYSLFFQLHYCKR
jgi:hypothetical protein